MPGTKFAGSKRAVAAVFRALAVLALIASPRPARGDDDAFRLLREEQLVTAASKRPQPMSETPSIVTVITAEEIRTLGYRTLGEALQTVRGLYTRYDRNYTFLGVRGVQRPGDYNNKVLLTLDGHTMNSPIYGDAAFGRELGLDLERVKRIEVIRGPGSALYGSNAVLAVVNVVTRDAPASPALETTASVGSLGERRAYVSMAAAKPTGPQVALSGSWTEVNGEDFDPLSGPAGLGPATRVPGVDHERSVQMLGSLVWKDVRLVAKLNERRKNVPTGAFGTRLGDPGTHTEDGHDFVELGARLQPAPTVEWGGRAYWDGSRYRGDYAYGPDSARYINRDLGTSDVIGAESRLHWRPAEHHIATFGAEGRWTLRALQQNEDLDPFYQLYTRSDLKSGVASIYAQDELQLGTRARATAGGRLDAEPGRLSVLSPRLDLHVGLGSLTSWKLMAGSAYRSPVPYETHYAFPGLVPNPQLLPERVTTLETSFERRTGSAEMGVSVYRSWIRDLIDVGAVDTLGTTTFVNRGRVASTGIEAEIDWRARPGLHLRADVARQRSREIDRPVNLSHSPYWNGHLVLTQAMRSSPIRLGMSVRWLGSRTTMADAHLPSFAVLDTRVAWVPRSAFELGFEVRNLLDAAYSDPGAAEHAEDSIRQDGRTVAVTLALRRGATQ